MSEIPKGLCQCGCGRKTSIAKETRERRGWIKGEPVRFIYNHHSKKEHHPKWTGGQYQRADGYKLILLPSHPRAHGIGYVYEHIVIVEKAMGKPLNRPHVVHHHTPEQLVACENDAYHVLLHQRQRALRKSGHAHWLKCRFCKQYDDPKKLNVQANRRCGCHRECQAEYDKNRKLNRV